MHYTQYINCNVKIIFHIKPTNESFSALDFCHNITHLENTVANIFDWMSPDFMHFSKTEFLTIGLPQQLSKLNYPTIHLPSNIILSIFDVDVGEAVFIRPRPRQNLRDRGEARQLIIRSGEAR